MRSQYDVTKGTLYKVSGDINIFCRHLSLRRKNIDSKQVSMSSKEVPLQGHRNREGTITPPPPSRRWCDRNRNKKFSLDYYLPPKIYRYSYGPALCVPTYLLIHMYSSLNICWNKMKVRHGIFTVMSQVLTRCTHINCNFSPIEKYFTSVFIQLATVN